MVLASICFMVLAPGTQTEPVLLRYKYVAGQTRRQRAHMEMDSQMIGTPAKLLSDTVMSTTIKTVYRDGSATVLSKVETYKLSINGQPYGAPPEITKPETAKVSQLGEPIGPPKKTGKDSPDAMFIDSSSLGSLGVLPKRPVSVGSTWHSAPSPAYSLSNKLVGLKAGLATIETNGTMDLSKVGAKDDKTIAGMKISGNLRMRITWTFDTKKGEMVNLKSDGDYSAVMKAVGAKPTDKGMSLTGKMTMTLGPYVRGVTK